MRIFFMLIALLAILGGLWLTVENLWDVVTATTNLSFATIVAKILKGFFYLAHTLVIVFFLDAITE
jgi:hypothetical protein